MDFKTIFLNTVLQHLWSQRCWPGEGRLTPEGVAGGALAELRWEKVWVLRLLPAPHGGFTLQGKPDLPNSS